MSTAVLDMGRCFTKAGRSGDEHPSLVMPTLVGRRHQCGMIGMQLGFNHVGEDVFKRPWNTPFGRCINPLGDSEPAWNEIEIMWQYIWEQQAFPSETGLALLENSSLPNSTRERYTQLAFETFSMPSLSLLPSSSMSFYQMGLQDGLLVDIGAEETRIVPMVQGLQRWQDATILPYGGETLTLQLPPDLSRKLSVQEIRDFRAWKEQHCYLSLQYAEEYQELQTFPSRQVADFDIGEEERVRLPEALFDTSLFSYCWAEDTSLPQAISRTISNFSEYSSSPLDQIVVTGGTAQLPHLIERLQVHPALSSRTVRTSPSYSAWMGASMYISQGEAPSLTQEEYDEEGPAAIHRLCPFIVASRTKSFGCHER